MDIRAATPCQSSELKPLIHTQVTVLARQHCAFSRDGGIGLKQSNCVETHHFFCAHTHKYSSWREHFCLKSLTVSDSERAAGCMFPQSALCGPPVVRHPVQSGEMTWVCRRIIVYLTVLDSSILALCSADIILSGPSII